MKSSIQSFFLYPFIWLLGALSLLPLPLLEKTSYFLGNMYFACFPKSRKIAFINLQLAFPQKPEAEIRSLARESFRYWAFGVLWALKHLFFAPNLNKDPNRNSAIVSKYIPHITFHGAQEIHEAIAQKKRILLLTTHCPASELSGILIAHLLAPITALYQASRYRSLEKVFVRRKKYTKHLIPSANPHAIPGKFNPGTFFLLFVDRNFGKKKSISIPFFSIPTATDPSSWRWAKMMDAEAFLLHPVILPGRRVNLFFQKVEDFGKMPREEALTLQNKKLEDMIRKYPAQYLWTTKRFQSRPNGAPSFYKK